MLDLDGVLWLAGNAISGSAEAVSRLRSSGDRVAFVTNNATPTVAEYVEKLARAGVAVEPGELVTSAQAAASLVTPGQRVSMVGGAGLREALAERGAELVDPAREPEAVVVGRSLKLDFAELAAAAKAVRGGARFVASNTDPTFPTPDGLEPGTGALVAYLQVGSGVTADVAGKPNQALARLVLDRFGRPDVVVGDQPATDGLLAERVGAAFALVLTGVTRESDLPVTPEPDLVAPDLAAVVARRAVLDRSSLDRSSLDRDG